MIRLFYKPWPAQKRVKTWALESSKQSYLLIEYSHSQVRPQFSHVVTGDDNNIELIKLLLERNMLKYLKYSNLVYEHMIDL
jgi:hypothetical protein